MTKFDAVEGLLGLDHRGHTRQRFSVNALDATGYGGRHRTAPARLAALRPWPRPWRAAGRVSVGLVVAPIMPVDGWREGTPLFDDVAEPSTASPPT